MASSAESEEGSPFGVEADHEDEGEEGADAEEGEEDDVVDAGREAVGSVGRNASGEGATQQWCPHLKKKRRKRETRNETSQVNWKSQ